MRTSLRRTGGALAAALLAMGVAPTPVSALGGNSTVCTGTVGATYAPALQPTPSPGPVQLSLDTTTLPCVGPATHSVTLSTVSGDQLKGASCTAPVAFVGGGTVGTDTVAPTQVEWVAAGTVLAQAWAFADLSNVPPLVGAAGTAAVLDPNEVAACLSGGVSNVTFTVVLVIVA